MGFSITAVKNGKPQTTVFEKLGPDIHEYDFVWVDAKGPTLKEMKELSKAFNFHYLSVENALAKGQLSRIEEFSEYVFLTVFEVSIDDLKLSTKRLSIFLGKNFIVTVHQDDISALQKVSENYRKDPTLLKSGAAFVLYNILDQIVDDYFPALDGVADSIDKLESEVFSKAKKQTLNKLFKLKRKIISFRRVVNPQREVLAHLARHENIFIPKDYLIYFSDIHSHLLRVSDTNDTYRELISDTFEAYLTVVSNRLNEIMKVLTIIATIMLPLTLVTGFYGMNVEFVEYSLFGQGGTYLFALGLMVVIAAIMVLWFKRKQWI